jgi:hypothetical protein
MVEVITFRQRPRCSKQRSMPPWVAPPILIRWAADFVARAAWPGRRLGLRFGRMPYAKALSFVLSGAVLFCCCRAAATPQPGAAVVRVRLTFSAPPGCPGEVTFRSQVQARTTRVEFAPEASPVLAVEIEKSEAVYVGKLGADWLSGASSEAPLAAESCDEVVAGLALLAALRVDANAAKVVELDATPVEVKPPASAPPPPASRVFELTLGAGGRTGLGRVASPSAGLGLSWVGRDGPRAWQLPDIHLGLMGVLGGELEKPGLQARLGLIGAVIDLCPLGTRFGLKLSVCLAAESGAVVARLTPEARVTSPLLAIGAAARLRWDARAFFAGLRAGGAAHILRPSYYFRPETPAYVTPLLVVEGAAYAGYSFR